MAELGKQLLLFKNDHITIDFQIMDKSILVKSVHNKVDLNVLKFIVNICFLGKGKGIQAQTLKCNFKQHKIFK